MSENKKTSEDLEFETLYKKYTAINAKKVSDDLFSASEKDLQESFQDLPLEDLSDKSGE